MTVARDELSRRLDGVAAKAGHELRRVRTRRTLVRAVDEALPLLIVVPAVFLALTLLLRLLGAVESAPSVLMLVAVTVLVPFVVVLMYVSCGWVRATDRRDALAVVDEKLGLEERLLTADEFLALEERTPFMEAALDDAERSAGYALGAAVALPTPRWRPGARLALIATGAALLVLAASWLGTWSTPGEDSSGDVQVARLSAGASVAPNEEPEAPEPETAAEVAQAGRKETPPAAPRQESAGLREPGSELPEEIKPSEGKTGTGRSAETQTASGASESRGAPSNQAQTSQRSEEKPKESEKKPKKKRDSAATPPTKKKNEEESGSTAGRGSSRGSNKNPAVSNWSSKDQVPSQDNDELEQDEETEDEEEEQEARGGVQPSLRDRKPPVSRDLRIGFGNQPNPDANGRGGPSQPKKSRGTASLVLGVPIPDRVKGQPNPGRTKITQERIEPRAEEAAALTAEERRAREAPVGYVARPDLAPWMRDLVRTYFLSLRKRTAGES